MRIEDLAMLSPDLVSVRARLLGAYYTPDHTAQALARWAIHSGDEVVLEPSAGAGALIRAALDRARQLSAAPGCRIIAFDIDPIAIQNLQALNVDELTIRQGDFLLQKPGKSPKVDLVLANPPFNRHHSITPKLREQLRDRFKTKGALGLWGHFLLHSLSFLKEGGRLASIVPRSVIFTHHGDVLLRRFCSDFRSVGIYELSGRPTWSNHADEVGAVVLAEGFKQGVCSKYKRGLITQEGLVDTDELPDCEPYQRISKDCVPLGALASLSIGAVTGRNRVFLLSEVERLQEEIALADVSPIVSRAKQISGITMGANELCTLAKLGHKTWLLAPKELNPFVERYLEIVEPDDRDSVVWFKKRTPWWKVQLAARYDAVFTYMNDLGPRIVELEAGISCTNTLHRIEYSATTSDNERVACMLTPISTFGQLAAEKIGRAYGGGVLKFELAEARRFPILTTATTFNRALAQRVDSLLRKNCLEEATNIVDEAFMAQYFGASWANAKAELAAELKKFRASRRYDNPKKAV